MRSFPARLASDDGGEDVPLPTLSVLPTTHLFEGFENARVRSGSVRARWPVFRLADGPAPR